MKFPINVNRKDLPYVEQDQNYQDISYLQVGSGNQVFRSDQSGLWTGGGKFSQGAFRVNMQGELVAEDAILKGTVQGSSGYIGGFVIGPTTLMAANRTVGMSSVVSGNVDWRFWAGSAIPSSAPFRVDESGNVYATSGEIGGWTINATSLTADSGNVGMSSEVTGGTDWRFWAGNSAPGSAEFRVDEDGNLYSESGEIGGWTINSDTLESDDGDIVLDPVNKKIKVADGNDKIEILHDGGRGYIDFYDGGARKARLRATTLGSGGLRLVSGDFTIDNNYSLLFEETGGTNYGRIGVTNSNEFWFVAPDTDETFYFLDASENQIAALSSTALYLGGHHRPLLQFEEQVAPAGSPSGNTAVMYLDSADGSLKVKFDDGDVVTIATY